MLKTIHLEIGMQSIRLYNLFHIELVTVDNEYLIVHAYFHYFYIYNDHCHQLN